MGVGSSCQPCDVNGRVAQRDCRRQTVAAIVALLLAGLGYGKIEGDVDASRGSGDDDAPQ